jgi:uncharacterized membrane protein
MSGKSNKKTGGPENPVGYKSPPVHTRFKKHQSGNPKGRPKGQKSASQIILEEAARMIKVKEGDKVMTIPKLRALIRKLFEVGLRGNMTATKTALALVALAEANATSLPTIELPLTEEELAVLKLIGEKGGVE